MNVAKRTANARSPYPRAFMTPDGRMVSIRAMARALRVIRSNPEATYYGWNWFQTPGHHIIHSFRRGLHDRINMRGALAAKAEGRTDG